MDVVNSLAIFLEIKIPGVCIDLLCGRRVVGSTRRLLGLFALAELRPARRLLAICACEFLLHRVQTVCFGVDAAPGSQLCAWNELRFRHIELPGADDWIRSEGRACK